MKDVILQDGDLTFRNHDFAIGESTLQHQRLLLVTYPGEWKTNPLVGVGLTDWLNDERSGNLITEVRRQFKSDGMEVAYITYEQGKLQIDAAYEK